MWAWRFLCQITLTGSDRLRVQKGDHYGFQWWNYGVISMKQSNTHIGSYCEVERKMKMGDRMTMFKNRRTGNRDYALRLTYKPCGKMSICISVRLVRGSCDRIYILYCHPMGQNVDSYSFQHVRLHLYGIRTFLFRFTLKSLISHQYLS